MIHEAKCDQQPSDASCICDYVREAQRVEYEDMLMNSATGN